MHSKEHVVATLAYFGPDRVSSLLAVTDLSVLVADPAAFVRAMREVSGQTVRVGGAGRPVEPENLVAGRIAAMFAVGDRDLHQSVWRLICQGLEAEGPVGAGRTDSAFPSANWTPPAPRGATAIAQLVAWIAGLAFEGDDDDERRLPLARVRRALWDGASSRASRIWLASALPTACQLGA
jgi:hypothetical protein